MNWKDVPTRRSSERRNILAIDLATKTGWARGYSSDDAPEFGTVNFGSKGKGGRMPGTGDAVFATALDWMATMLDPVPDILIVESLLPPEAMKDKTSRQVRDRLAGLHGVIRAVAKRAGVGEITEVSVGDTRAHFIGTRTLRRDDAKRDVMDRCLSLGWHVNNDNEGDACAIWSFAVSLIDPNQSLRVSPLFNKQLRVGR